MSKGGSGDEFELKPIDEQADAEAGAQQPVAEEFDISFEPVSEPAGQPAEFVSTEPRDVGPSVGQPSGEADISAEQFISAGEQEPGEEASGFVQPTAEAEEPTAAQSDQQQVAGKVAPFEPKEEVAPFEPKEEEEEEQQEEEARPNIFARLAEASPYTVLLGAAFVALLIGVIFLLLELKTYDFDTGGKKARQGAMDRPAATSWHRPGIA